MPETKLKHQESRDERFVRLAEVRVNALLEKMRLLGQLANKRNYSYSEDQVNAIFRAIQYELNSNKAKFREGTTGPKKFKL